MKFLNIFKNVEMFKRWLSVDTTHFPIKASQAFQGPTFAQPPPPFSFTVLHGSRSSHIFISSFKILMLFIIGHSKGSWFSRFWGLWQSNKELKIVIIGLNNAGKTTLLYKLLLDEVVVTPPTIGANVEEVTYKNLKFLCWDIGGQNALRQTWVNYFADTDAIMYVVDSTDKERLGVAKEELLNSLKHESLESASVLVFANKSDVKGALTPSDISDALGLSQITSHQWHLQSCCALTGEGLSGGMDWIAQRIEAKQN